MNISLSLDFADGVSASDVADAFRRLGNEAANYIQRHGVLTVDDMVGPEYMNAGPCVQDARLFRSE